MPSLTPLETALAIVVVLAAIGVILYYFRHSAQFSGFEEIEPEVRHIRRAVSGEVFRDGADLVISGQYASLPVLIRFSYLENTPGLNIQMKAPATFALSCTPRASDAEPEGRVPIKLSDPVFDSRFTTRTDYPLQAKMFLGAGPQVPAAIKKLCSSANTFFSITAGNMELSELVIPPAYAGRHVTEHLQSLRTLARALAEMPGADRVAIKRVPRDRYAVARVAIAIGVIAAIAAVAMATRDMAPGATAIPAAEFTPPEGVLPLDAAAIPNLDGWRLATAEDFDPAAAAWLRAQRIQPAGRFKGRFSPQGGPRDVAYVLRNDAGAWRVVLLADGQNRYDATHDQLAAVARFPAAALAGAQWAGPAPEDVEHDGILLIRRPGDRASGLALFLHGQRLLSAVPANYEALRLN
jgi:hypothetical protein